MYYTTLEKIRSYHPCAEGWTQLLKFLGKTKADDEPLALLTILESNGLDDAIWALRAIDDCPEIRLFAVRCMREVQHLFNDPRSLQALDIAELYAVGEATKEELAVVKVRPWDGTRIVLWESASHAAWDAAMEVIVQASWEAVRAIKDLDLASKDAARVAARENINEIQRRDFIDIFCS